MSQSKLTDEQRVEIAELHVLGKTHAELAKQFGVSPTTIQKTTSRINVGRPTKPTQGLRSMPAAALTEFSKRAKSILWRQDGVMVKKSYDRWKRLVEELKTDGGCTREQAIIQASKDFPCLKRLFREYNVNDYDPNPDSHPGIEHWGQKVPMDGVENENLEQSFRENLAWAIEAAGKYLRTGEAPTSTPNDGAYFLFKQACEEPKDFLGKFTQVEGRGDDDKEKQRLVSRGGKKAIEEIDEMLSSLTGLGDENNDE